MIRKALVTILFLASASQGTAQNLPMPPREFRAAWVATVANIDWPSRPDLSEADQRAELQRIIDRAAELNLNALIFQVRPACDAMYRSDLEPWSEYLSGEMGKGPSYDPLASMVEMAHARGVELHAWFNPYRALHPTHQGSIADNHISNTSPNAVKKYGEHLWLDPGNPDAAQHTIAVILDVLERYDIDGIHFDDYFYPYPIKDDNGIEVPFPDRTMFKDNGRDMEEADWRRDNVNRLIRNLHEEIERRKPHVKFGVSPFGIWRPGHPESIKGFDAYDQLYADARRWLREGWVDYLTPQLYWSVDSAGQSYPKLLDWWIGENYKGIPIWPGNYASKIGFEGDKRWGVDEILNQIKITRESEASGNVLFSMKSLFDDYGELGTSLKDGPYREVALVPQTGQEPDDHLAIYRHRPQLKRSEDGQVALTVDGVPSWKWVVWSEHDGKWRYDVFVGKGEVKFDAGDGHRIAIASVTRTGHMTDVEYYPVPK